MNEEIKSGISFISYDDGEYKRQEDNFIDLYFRFLAAKRDYPYAEHRPPSILGCVCFDFKRVARECELEFRRSNPGFELR